MRGLILRRKTGTVSVEVFTFHAHLATAPGNRMTWALLSCSTYFVRIPLPFEPIFFLLQQRNKIYRLTSKRLLFWCYSPCSEDSEQDSCSNKIKTCHNCLLLFAAHAGIKKRQKRLMKRIISSLQLFSMFSDL